LTKGLPTIRAYNEEARFLQTATGLIDKNLGPFFVLTVAGRWLGLRLESLGALLVFMTALLGVLPLNIALFTPSIFGVVLSYALQITGQMNWCVRQFTEAENAMNAVEV
jgi:ABC-type multidrug transport system fused ATPase/permease subunit